jgi:hypothetical protein
MRHPIDGITGSKPRVPGASGNGKPTKAELGALNREYSRARNRAQAAKAEAAEMAVAEKKGTLISRQLVILQAAYLLTAFRGRVLSEPGVLTGRLLRERLIEAKDQHAVRELVTSDLFEMLENLAKLPSQVVDQNNIDEDLAGQLEGISEFRQTPWQAKAAAEKARVRREQKAATERKRRAEGRVKS